jgi:hypothetical protein
LIGLHVRFYGWEWNAYSVLYFSLVLTMLVGWWLLRRVPETKAMSTEDFLHEMLVKMPARSLAKWVGRRPTAL